MNKTASKNAGLLATVYRAAGLGDCTNGGITSRVDQVVIVGEGSEIFEPSDDAPAVVIVRKSYRFGDYMFAKPVALGDRQSMFGGNYITCSDSRVRAINKYPIPVHDRIED